MGIIFFESKRLWYRAPEMEDVPILQRWINDPKVRRTLTLVLPTSSTAEKQWVESTQLCVGQAPAGVSLLFGLKGGDRIIGSSSLMSIDWTVRTAEWGIVVGDPDNWNKGFGREVATAFLRYAFVSLNLNRVQLRVNSGNTGGIKAYLAAGFVQEGVLRQAAFVDGQPQDMLIMSVLKDEWSDKDAN